MTTGKASLHPGQIYVVDDDADLAGSLARMLGRRGYPALAFSDADAFSAHSPVPGPACLLTDVLIGDTNGLDLARRLRPSRPSLAVLFMTTWPRVADAVEAIRDLGGVDYLEKPLDQDRLVMAVARGLEWSRARHERATRLAPLSQRETEIFGLLILGRTNKTIAAQLDLSIKTVEDHRAAVMRKTGSNSLAQLIDLSR
jgi:FixJ family two-component response regulator